MKRRFFTVVTLLLLSGLIHSYAMVINTNQSAEYIRLLNRNASTNLDAVLYNPAGLTKLENGTYLYISNQTIWQTREVVVMNPVYNSDTFRGETFVPSFPNIYIVYRKDRFALSTGFMPIGGGGSADFPDGLPSFDYQLAQYVQPQVTDIHGYSVKSSFIGSSIYLGFQGVMSYAINDVISIGLGARYISAKNTYEGNLRDATLFYTADRIPLTHETSPDRLPPDIYVESERTGTAFTGLIGLNLSPIDGLNVGLRYEHITKLKVKASTKRDDTTVLGEPGMFPDGETYNEDIPAQIGAGVSYQLNPVLKAEIGFNYFRNTQCDWDGDEKFVTDDFNTGAGIEYALSEVLTVSAGYLYSTTGATDKYQTDMDYSLPSQTFGGGLKYTLNPTTALSLGISNTFYKEGQNEDVGTMWEETSGEKYRKTALVIAMGVQHRF